MEPDIRSDKHSQEQDRFHPGVGSVSLLLIVIGVVLYAFYIVLPYIPYFLFLDSTPPRTNALTTSRTDILGTLLRVSIGSGIPGILLRVAAAIVFVLLAVTIAARYSLLPQISARLRLTASYALFLVVAGSVLLVGIYLVLRYVPIYPMAGTGAPGLNPNVVSRREILGALVRVSGVILVVLAIVGAWGGWILAGWILRPLQRINEAAQIAATGRLDHRIRLAGRNDEFRQLADAFDHMLDRLHDAFSVQERFAANASHELRTPLTINATLLDVARRNPAEQDYEMLIERLRITNARAIGLTEALLRLADANSIQAHSEPVDLADIARDAIDECADEAGQRRILIDADLAGAPANGDPTLLRQLTTNLLQNAIRHNSATGSAYARIETTHDTRRSNVLLRVENTGQPYTPEQVATFTEPFLRGEGRIRQFEHERGYGLGLALVARIVDVHGGSLSLVPRTGGGLIVVAAFPARIRVANDDTNEVQRLTRSISRRPRRTATTQ